MVKKMVYASVIIPAYNEEKKIKEVIDRTRRVSRNYEIIVVDDGSTDRTVKIAKRSGIKVLRVPKNTGKANACLLGAKATKSQNIVFVDGDLQLLPEEIPLLLKKLKGCDMVIGKRNMSTATRKRVMANKFARWLVNKTTGQNFGDVLCGLRAVKKDVFLDLGISSKGYELEAEMLIKAVRKGKNIREQDVKVVYHGGKGMGFWDGVRVFLFILKNTFTR